MSTLATQTISVTLPWDAATFLQRKAERHNISVPNAIATIIIGTMKDEAEKIHSDPLAALFEFHKTGGIAPATADEYLRQARHDRKNWGQCPA